MKLISTSARKVGYFIKIRMSIYKLKKTNKKIKFSKNDVNIDLYQLII